MRLSRTDLVAPVLAIVVGGVIGASLSFSFLGSRSGDLPAPDPVVVLSATAEAVRLEEQKTRAAIIYLLEQRAGTVHGQITDAQSGQPIPAVQVFIRSLDLGGLSQQNGRFLLQNVPAGTYTLTVARIDRGTLEDVVEPYLIHQGFLSRTPRGRVATRLARDYFGIPLRAAAAGQPKLL